MVNFYPGITQDYAFEEMKKKNMTPLGFRESYQDNTNKIIREIMLKEFKGNLQCFCCGEYFNPYKFSMHCMSETTFTNPDGEMEVINPEHFLCDDCHNSAFGEDINAL